MLPLWPNQLLVNLGEQHVSVIYRSGLRKKVLSQQERTVLADVGKQWQGSLQSLSLMIDALNLPTGVVLKLNIASEFVRYLVLPAMNIEITYSEKAAYAQAAYRDVYGAESLGWSVKCDDAHPASSTLCTAIDQSLWESLQSLTQKYRVRISSVQPYFIRAINVLSRDIENFSGVVLVVERARLIMANVHNGFLTQLRAHVLTADWQQQLPDMLARAALLDDDLGNEVLVYAPCAKSIVLNRIKGWKIKRIGTSAKQGNESAEYAMLEVLA